jgi:hypothetical protein
MQSKFFRRYNVLVATATILSFLFLNFTFSSCGIYGFSEKGVVADSARTVRVAPFENKAPYVNPQITPALTERLRQKILNQTKLTNTNNENAHYNIVGYIADYSVSTVGVSTANGQQQTSQNRLNVRVHISLSKFGGTPEEFDVSRSFDFSAQRSLQAAEAELLDEIIRNVTDEIFNRIFSNW